MPTAAQVLGKFAAELTYSSIPREVVERAKDCIIDTVGVVTFGAQFPWSQFVANYARRYGGGGPCSMLGVEGVRVQAPYAALANGAFAHAFEQDSVRDPGVGAHPGATLVPPVLAMCEETGADGKTAIAAFVAGCEVMLRVAAATHHSPEKIGFHSPGLTGCYGAAVAAGRVLGLNTGQLVNAIGISGSLSSGLLAFTKSEGGAMIKRLHLGRASESGILAARLASEGYAGPETVLEGKFGFLEAYCRDLDTEPPLLTANLGKEWEVMRICMKRYAAHINAHTPVQSTRELMAEHDFGAADVAEFVIEGSERLMTHHNIPEPGDLMQAQYSVPFCVAVALHRDPDDPRSFAVGALEDAAIRATCRSVKILTVPGRTPRSTHVKVRLKDGREVTRDSDTFKGMPRSPLGRADLRRKFALLTAGAGERISGLFQRLEHLETEPRFAL